MTAVVIVVVLAVLIRSVDPCVLPLVLIAGASVCIRLSVRDLSSSLPDPPSQPIGSCPPGATYARST
jgi:hypothetical protein